jgi:hypothetical protein
MRTASVTALLTLCSSAVLAGSASDRHPAGPPLPLTSVAAVSSLDAPTDADDPGTGGGFETEAYFQTRLTSAKKIAECTTNVEQVVEAWSHGLKLVQAFRERSPNALTLHYAATALQGFFSVTYSVSLGNHARVRVDFYALDGTPKPPELAVEINHTYGIDGLEDSLNRAIACGSG